MSFHQKDRWGNLKNPKEAYDSFRHNRSAFPPGWSWKRQCEAYRKKKRKRRIERLSRRRNRR